MCGIAGEWRADRREGVDAVGIRAMTDALVHRGPDGEGIRTGPGYGLGHRRLAIVDLEGGAQPMDDGGDPPRVLVSFNGEIYNHEELRRELEAAGAVFRTRCDTEVLVHGWLHWGERLPERLRGMFAFAVLDLRDHTLLLARDRLGKKPLVYAALEGGDRLLFASETKALLARPEVPRALDDTAVLQFFCLRYVPDPRTAFAAVRRLPPGHRLVVRPSERVPRIEAYWRLPPPSRFAGSRADAEAEFLARLDEAVRIRLMGDVPLGAFLSGGIDSQMVVDSMARQRGDGPPVRACTMGFDDPSMDERPAARDAARRCGAQLEEGVVDVAAMRDIGWYDAVFDEPFADGSAIPTWHVSALARRHVTVALSGDGGDESFAGYRRYRFDRLENRLRALLPRPLWRMAAMLYPKADWAPRPLRLKRTLENLARSPDLAYARSVSANLPEEVAPLLAAGPVADLAAGAAGDGAADPFAPIRDAWRGATGDPLDRAVAADLVTWLAGDVLTKVDRTSMAVSLEVRCPLLDHELVEWARSIPVAWKLEGGTTKAFLRRALRGRLGDAALERPKQGFHVPLRRWFREGLGDEFEARLEAGGFAGGRVDPDAARQRLRTHRSGVRDHGEMLWAMLCFDRFVKRWVS